MNNNTYNRDLHTHTIKEYEVQNNTTTARDFTIGFTLGALAGSLIGLLLAPKSGSELQEDINVKAQNLKEKSTATYQEQVEKSKSLKEKTAQFTEKMNEKAAVVKEKVSKNGSKVNVTASAEDLQAQKHAIKKEVNDETLSEPIAIVDKELETPIKDEALSDSIDTKTLAKKAEEKAKNNSNN